jgi:AAA family ATP:ADP antiporter
MAVAALFLLCGYEFIRSTSQSLFIGAYGARRLPIVMAMAPVFTLLIVYGYGRLLSRSGPRRALLLTCLLSAAVILGCQAAIQAGLRSATGVLYVFREAYIVLLIEQIWSFLNSTLPTAEGRKLNGPVCGIASLGAIAGGLLVHGFAVQLGSANLLMGAALSLIPTALAALLAYRIGGEPAPLPEEAGGRHGHLGLRLLAHSATLRRLAILIALTQVVAAVLDLQLSRQVELTITLTDERTRWFGGFYANLNVWSAAFQFVLAPLLLHYASLRLVHAAIPLVHVSTCLLALARPSLATAGAAYLAFKTLDYSLFRAAKELIYVPLSFDARYRAKEIIDAFVYRLAKGGASGALAVVGSTVLVPLAGYPLIALVALAGWLPLAFLVTRGKEPSR